MTSLIPTAQVNFRSKCSLSFWRLCFRCGEAGQRGGVLPYTIRRPQRWCERRVPRLRVLCRVRRLTRGHGGRRAHPSGTAVEQRRRECLAIRTLPSSVCLSGLTVSGVAGRFVSTGTTICDRTARGGGCTMMTHAMVSNSWPYVRIKPGWSNVSGLREWGGGACPYLRCT